jgi:hypothetical protein
MDCLIQADYLQFGGYASGHVSPSLLAPRTERDTKHGAQSESAG